MPFTWQAVLYNIVSLGGILNTRRLYGSGTDTLPIPDPDPDGFHAYRLRREAVVPPIAAVVATMESEKRAEEEAWRKRWAAERGR